jgi:hypothetical protein
MKYFVHTLILLCSPLLVFCQDITGLWKGTLFNNCTQQTLQYEVMITKEKGKFTGFAYTSFLNKEQKYYGIKKINVRVARDGKIVIQDGASLESNNPEGPKKDVYQLNVLDLANSGDETQLDGLFVTNGTKEYKSISGHVSMKKVNPLGQSDLMSYLNRNNADNSLAAVK